MMKFVFSCVTFKFTKSWRKRQRMFLRMVDKYILRALSVLPFKDKPNCLSHILFDREENVVGKGIVYDRESLPRSLSGDS